jgi:ribonuclease HI
MDQQICKNCGTTLEIKATKKTPAQQKKSYFYSHYYFCPNCKRLYHDDKFKIINPQSMSLNFTPTRQIKPKLTSHLDNFDVQIWTDGACIYNGTPKAKAAWAFVAGKVERAGPVPGLQTNNRAEGLAIYHALKWAGEEGYKKIKLHTDSQISLFNVNKHHSKVKANNEIFVDIAKVIATYGLEIQYEKVLGHSGNPNNERADSLANRTASGV